MHFYFCIFFKSVQSMSPPKNWGLQWRVKVSVLTRFDSLLHSRCFNLIFFYFQESYQVSQKMLTPVIRWRLRYNGYPRRAPKTLLARYHQVSASLSMHLTFWFVACFPIDFFVAVTLLSKASSHEIVGLLSGWWWYHHAAACLCLLHEGKSLKGKKAPLLDNARGVGWLCSWDPNCGHGQLPSWTSEPSLGELGKKICERVHIHCCY